MARPLLPLLLAALMLSGCHHTRVNQVTYCGSHATATSGDGDVLLLVPFLVLWTLLSLADG